MRWTESKRALAFAAALQVAGCGDNGGEPTATQATTETPGTTDETGGTTDEPTTAGPTTLEPTTVGPTTDDPTTEDPTGPASSLCDRMGGPEGIGELIGIFVGEVIADERINAYFLSSDVDGGNLSKCLTDQVGAAVRCPGVTYGCGGMKEVHQGMGVSMSDFGDLAEDFVLAWDEYQAEKAPDLTQEDKDTVVGALAAMAPDIVEDPENAGSIYQRVGRRPAIKALVGKPDDPMSFVGVVAADAAINSFFASSNFDRLNTCLTRQLTGATGGPSHYGKEVEAPPDPGVSADSPCLDMVSSHKDLKDADDEGITVDDFLALAMDLGTAMNSFDVGELDQMDIVAALVPMCPEIVTVDPQNCP